LQRINFVKIRYEPYINNLDTMEKILIPTDFSLTAEKAYKLGAEIARKTEAEIILLHIIPTFVRKGLTITGLIDPTAGNNEEEISIAKDILTKLVAKDIFAGLTVSTELIEKTNEDIPTTITRYQTDEEIDLIVVGTDGARTSRRNYTPIIVRQANCPVISIDQEPETFTLKNMVLATDFVNTNYKMMDNVWNLQQLFEAKLTILYVNTPHYFKDTQKIENEYNLFVNRYELDNTELAVFNDHILEDGILKYAERVNADMLLMSTHGRTGLSHLFSKSHAEYVVSHSKVPVYVYNMHMDELYNYVSSGSTGGFTGV